MQIIVNGRKRTVTSPPMARLLDVLREEFGLTGTKEGCGEGECGACTVIADGQAVCSCLVPVAQVKSVTTIEGIRSPVQKKFVECGGAQCGICTPGMILMALARKDRKLREALAGNLCRCTGYEAIYRSLK